MNTRTAIIISAVVIALIGVIGLTMYLLQSQQDVRSRASNEVIETQPPLARTQDASCPVPAIVSNVQVEFPDCEGDQCNLTQASCTWNFVDGAPTYKLVVTEVETNTIIKNENVSGSLSKVSFAIKQNYTYKCDVSAVNSCGVAGPAGSHSLLCQVDALISTPTPIPPTPTIPQNDCGYPCTSTNNCKSGLTCAMINPGQGYCAIPTLESNCKSAPSISACCSMPTTVAPTAIPVTPKPTLAPAGIFDKTFAIGGGALVIILIGGLLFLW